MPPGSALDHYAVAMWARALTALESPVTPSNKATWLANTNRSAHACGEFGVSAIGSAVTDIAETQM